MPVLVYWINHESRQTSITQSTSMTSRSAVRNTPKISNEMPFRPDSIFLGSALKRKSARLASAVESPKESSILLISGLPTIGRKTARSIATPSTPIPTIATRMETKKGSPSNEVLKKPMNAPII